MKRPLSRTHAVKTWFTYYASSKRYSVSNDNTINNKSHKI